MDNLGGVNGLEKINYTDNPNQIKPKKSIVFGSVQKPKQPNKN